MGGEVISGGNEVSGLVLGAAGEDLGGIIVVCDSVDCGDKTFAILLFGRCRR
jgi:hypothetical protein